jgi:hypothetical protein
MKAFFFILVIVASTLAAQEPTGPIPPTQPESGELPAFQVRSSVTQQVMREEPAPLPGMVPVCKSVTETVEVVDDPQLPVKPVPEPGATRVLSEEERAQLQATQRVIIPIIMTATVYDHQRTLLRWYPHGNHAPSMSAWSTIDFNVLCGVTRFVFENQEFHLLLMPVENVDTEKRRLMAQQLGREYQAPQYPEFPEPGNAVFVVTQGDATDAAALKPVKALHALYLAESAELHEEYAARLTAQAQREATLRANPPEPQDVLIRVWKSEMPADAVTDVPEKILAPLVERPVEP